MVHSFTANLQQAFFQRTGEPHIATQGQNFSLPLQLSLIRLARPVLSRRIQLKTGIGNGADAGGGIMHQAGAAEDQFNVACWVLEAGGKIAQGVIKARVGQCGGAAKHSI